MTRTLLLAVVCVAGCAHPQPEQKNTPAKPATSDEFQGFGALRTEPRAKKKDDAAAKDDGKEDAKADAKSDAKEASDDGEEKTALNKEQVLTALNSVQKRVDACFKKYKDPGIYVMKITIANNGSCEVEAVRAPTRKEEPSLWTEAPADVDGGKNPKSPTSRCVVAAMGQVKFPTFQGKPLVVNYPLVLH